MSPSTHQSHSSPPPDFWPVFLRYAKQLLRSAEIRTLLGSVVLIWLTDLFGAGVVVLVVVALAVGFLIGVVRGPAILRALFKDSTEGSSESTAGVDEESRDG